MDELPGPDTLRILITSDNHVGYNENDPITGNDSWKTFREVMMIAKEKNVDMVLQGGDLFHVNKPSKKSMFQVMSTLRSTCMGDKPCELELLSDPSMVFQYGEFTNINYEDPNFNISIPVFCISGNHDDSSGDALLSPMDILQVSGLVNHLGKVMESDNIEVTPLLFQKGNTKLALYGLASVRDERLFRTFKEGNVKFNVPAMREGEWFNLMCVHQNHTGHTNTAFLPEQFLPDFLDLIVWGHEHECIPHLVHNPTKGFDVLQPGSTVATSLCEAESKPKQTFILDYEHGKPPRFYPIPLKTVRPFIMEDISLQEVVELKPHDKEATTRYLIEKVEEMIASCSNSTAIHEQQPEHEEDSTSRMLPLIRLRVDYSGKGNSSMDYQVENPRRFSNRFVGRIANTNNVVQYYKKKKQSTSKKEKKTADMESAMNDKDGDLEVQTLVNDMLQSMNLSLLPEVGMNEAVSKFVDKDEKSALKEFIDNEIKNEVSILASNADLVQDGDVNDIKKLVKEVRIANSQRRTDRINQQEAAAALDVMMTVDRDIEEGENNLNILPELTTRGSVPKRTSRKRSSNKKPVGPEIIESEDEEFVPSPISVDDDDVEINDKPEQTKAERNQHGIDDGKIEVQSTGRRKTKATKAVRKTSTKTPKTDILNSLLAKKRR